MMNVSVSLLYHRSWSGKPSRAHRARVAGHRAFWPCRECVPLSSNSSTGFRVNGHVKLTIGFQKYIHVLQVCLRTVATEATETETGQSFADAVDNGSIYSLRYCNNRATIISTSMSEIGTSVFDATRLTKSQMYSWPWGHPEAAWSNVALTQP